MYTFLFLFNLFKYLFFPSRSFKYFILIFHYLNIVIFIIWAVISYDVSIFRFRVKWGSYWFFQWWVFFCVCMWSLSLLSNFYVIICRYKFKYEFDAKCTRFEFVLQFHNSFGDNWKKKLCKSQRIPKNFTLIQQWYLFLNICKSSNFWFKGFTIWYKTSHNIFP